MRRRALVLMLAPMTLLLVAAAADSPTSTTDVILCLRPPFSRDLMRAFAGEVMPAFRGGGSAGSATEGAP